MVEEALMVMRLRRQMLISEAHRVDDFYRAAVHLTEQGHLVARLSLRVRHSPDEALRRIEVLGCADRRISDQLAAEKLFEKESGGPMFDLLVSDHAFQPAVFIAAKDSRLEDLGFRRQHQVFVKNDSEDQALGCRFTLGPDPPFMLEL